MYVCIEGRGIIINKINIGLVSLGCDKNRVDAELMLGVLKDKDYNIVNDEESADVLIINTCGFIESAKQESIDTILELADYKVNGRCKVLIATGCLAERYSSELVREIPELDAVLGVGNYMEIDSCIREVLGGRKGFMRTNNINYDVDFTASRVLTTSQYTAYIKIAEGCDNGCSFCIIPKIRGSYRSRSMEKIVEEARQLSLNGTKEVILVAQDSARYGIDLYGKRRLNELINSISKLEGIKWIRLLYCYPENINDELISEISDNDKVCKYIDIPIQHVNNEILKNMKRASSKKSIEDLIVKLRERIPGIVIRTSLIVGFPGETDEQFMELYNFVEDYRLDRVGVFAYSQEEGTDAAMFENQVDEKIKKKRQSRLMSLQRIISSENNRKKLGAIEKVLVDGNRDDSILVCRTYGDAPEIDGVTYVRNSAGHYSKGDFIDVRIVEALEYDLVGELV